MEPWCENHNDVEGMDLLAEHYRREALRERQERLVRAWDALAKYFNLTAEEVSDEVVCEMEYLVRLFGRSKT